MFSSHKILELDAKYTGVQQSFPIRYMYKNRLTKMGKKRALYTIGSNMITIKSNKNNKIRDTIFLPEVIFLTGFKQGETVEILAEVDFSTDIENIRPPPYHIVFDNMQEINDLYETTFNDNTLDKIINIE